MIDLSRQPLIASMLLGVVLGMAVAPQGPQGEPGQVGAQGPAAQSSEAGPGQIEILVTLG